MLAQWYRSGGKTGRPLQGQALIDLAFDLGRMPDELQQSDPVWLDKMLVARKARIMATKER